MNDLRRVAIVSPLVVAQLTLFVVSQLARARGSGIELFRIKDEPWALFGWQGIIPTKGKLSQWMDKRQAALYRYLLPRTARANLCFVPNLLIRQPKRWRPSRLNS